MKSLCILAFRLTHDDVVELHGLDRGWWGLCVAVWCIVAHFDALCGFVFGMKGFIKPKP